MRPFANLILTLLLCIPVAEIAQSKRPELPFFDWNACPFEGCSYRQWTAQKKVLVYDTWKHTRQEVAKLAAGQKVTAVTGVVITYKPGIIRMDRDLPERGLMRGDTILTYAYRGEGTSAAWVNGKYDPSFDISFTKWPDGGGCQRDYCAATYVDLGKKEWWAKIKLKSGQTGWVNMDTAEFGGVDVLG
jgi:hypothetical protein